MINAEDVVKVQNKVRITILLIFLLTLSHIGIIAFLMEQYTVWIGVWNLPAAFLFFLTGYCFKSKRVALRSYRAGLDFCERNTFQQISPKRNTISVSPNSSSPLLDQESNEERRSSTTEETQLFISPSSSTYSI